MKLSVYGRKVEIVRLDDRWSVFFLGNEGKKRTADNIFIPSDLKKHELKGYMEDLCHEWATPSNGQIIEIG